LSTLPLGFNIEWGIGELAIDEKDVSSLSLGVNGSASICNSARTKLDSAV